MSLLVVGSVAFDALESPYGKVDRTLGGAATYFAVSASFFAPVSLVAIVGEDFTAKDEAVFRGRHIDTEGLERAAGKTFFWAGRYSENLNERVTLATDLNVFAGFKPKLPEKYKSSKYVFLANIAPDLQRDVLKQVKGRPKLAALDTMNYWIERTPRGIARDAKARRYSNDQRFGDAPAFQRTQPAARRKTHFQDGTIDAGGETRRIRCHDGRQTRRILRAGVSAGGAARSRPGRATASRAALWAIWQAPRI